MTGDQKVHVREKIFLYKNILHDPIFNQTLHACHTTFVQGSFSPGNKPSSITRVHDYTDARMTCIVQMRIFFVFKFNNTCWTSFLIEKVLLCTGFPITTHNTAGCVY